MSLFFTSLRLVVVSIVRVKTFFLVNVCGICIKIIVIINIYILLFLSDAVEKEEQEQDQKKKKTSNT